MRNLLMVHEKFEPEISKIVSLLLAGITGMFFGLYNSSKICNSRKLKYSKSIALYAALASIVVKEGMYW